MSISWSGDFFLGPAHPPSMRAQGEGVATMPHRPRIQIARNPLKRALLLVAGTISLALGTLGIFIRGILPTTPFLLLAAYCYGRSSKRMYEWIYGHRVFGPILIDWEDHKSLTRKTKTVAITSVWIGILLSISVLHFTVDPARQPYLQAMLVLVATFVTTFLATRPTSTRGQGPTDQSAPDRGLDTRTKTLTILLVWTGILTATAILLLQGATALGPVLWAALGATGLTLTASLATQPRKASHKAS